MTKRAIISKWEWFGEFWDCLFDDLGGEYGTNKERDSAEKKFQVSKCAKSSSSESIFEDSVSGIIILCCAL